MPYLPREVFGWLRIAGHGQPPTHTSACHTQCSVLFADVTRPAISDRTGDCRPRARHLLPVDHFHVRGPVRLGKGSTGR